MKELNSLGDRPPSLLITNLRIPQLRGDLVRRNILMERMDLAQNYRLTLISAPAGFGKTTILGQWISINKTGNGRERAVWVSLESECDLRQFWMYITVALGETQPGIGESALTLFDAPQPPIHKVARILINDISEASKDFILILDDYHHVDDPAIHATLTFFIDHLPSNLHLIVASRSEPPLPLARWRASNELYELREDQLRFTSVEVAAFFNEAKRLNLLPQEMTALERRTEGWIAGLQLVALSMEGFDDRSKHHFISEFTGSQRYILDYLLEEVLQRQPDHIKTFLLETSILNQLNASLCNAVTELQDSQSVLEYLERTHLFTIPLDHEQRWYRYHHLFKDVLYHQLMQIKPNAVLVLHRRAMEWFIHTGRTENAIQHACAAQEWDRAIKLIEQGIDIAWNRSEIGKIVEWLEKLPSEQLDRHANLSLYYSRALLHGGQLEAANLRLQKAEKRLRVHLRKYSNGDQQLLGMICALRTTTAAVSIEPKHALDLGREALSLLTHDKLDMRAYVLNATGVAHYYLGNLTEATRLLTEGGELARKAGVLRSMMVAASFRAEALIGQGQIRQAELVLREALDEVTIAQRSAQPWTAATSLICAIYGHLLYEWNRLEECMCYLNEAIELGQQHAFSRPLWLAYHTLVRVKLAYGDQEGALAMYKQIQQYQRMHSLPVPLPLIQAKQVRARLLLGLLEDAEVWARTYDVEGKSSAIFIKEFERIALARVYLSQNQFEKALALLHRLRLSVESSDRGGHLIEILALTALAQHALGQAQQSVETLKTALHLAEPEGYIRTFVDAGRPMAALLYKALELDLFPNYVAKLLTHFPSDDVLQPTSTSLSTSSHTRASEESLIEPLSRRELEVLQLVATGASNEGIADHLVIAPTTAKKHVSNILRKLGVENRTQAVARGRSMGLCE
jgi:LuxR family transcriptional regulator, maltose regulon positive regulatory protein